MMVPAHQAVPFLLKGKNLLKPLHLLAPFPIAPKYNSECKLQ